MPEKQRFLTIGEAAEFLHVSEVSLRRWTNSGKLRCFRIGGRSERRFLIEDLLAFMPSTNVEPQATETESTTYPASHGRHICLFFRNLDEQWQMLRPYFLEYLGTNMPVFYNQESRSLEQLMELLRAEGLPAEDLIASGLLQVRQPSESYLLTGRFDAQRMLAFMESSILAAVAAGHDRVLLTGEMTWSLSNPPGVEGMMKYEAALNPLVEKYPGVTIVCQYNLKRFDGSGVLDALLTHPSVHISSGQVPGYYGL